PISTLPLLRLLTRLAILAFSFHAPAPTEIYTLSLHDALPIFLNIQDFPFLIETRNTIALRILHIITKDDRLSFRFHLLFRFEKQDRKSTRLNSSHVKISYAVFCLKKKKIKTHSVFAISCTEKL